MSSLKGKPKPHKDPASSEGFQTQIDAIYARPGKVKREPPTEESPYMDPALKSALTIIAKERARIAQDKIVHSQMSELEEYYTEQHTRKLGKEADSKTAEIKNIKLDQELEEIKGAGASMGIRKDTMSPEMMKVLMELSEEKRPIALGMLQQYQMYGNPNNPMVMMMLMEQMKKAPVEQIQQAQQDNPISIVKQTFDLLKQMDSFIAARIPQVQPVTAQPMSEPKKSQMEEEVNKRFMQVVLGKLDEMLGTRPSSEIPITQIEEGDKTIDLKYDERSQMYVPTKITYPQYLEIQALRDDKLEKQATREQEKKKYDVIGKELIRPIMKQIEPKIGRFIDSQMPQGKDSQLPPPASQQQQYDQQQQPQPQQQQQQQRKPRQLKGGQQEGQMQCNQPGCGAIIKYPYPPQPGYIAVCPKCRFRYQFQQTQQKPQPQQQQQPPQPQEPQSQEQPQSEEQTIQGSYTTSSDE